MSESYTEPRITLTSFTGEKCTVHSNYRGQLESVDNFDRISTLGEGTYGLVSELSTGKMRAIKALKEQHGRDLDVCVLRETKLLSSLHHPNIIGLYGVLSGSSIKKTYLMMEICQQDGVLKIGRAELSVSDCKFLADFGMARHLAPPTNGAMTPGVVTLWYRAPELLLSCPDYGYSVDMWYVHIIDSISFLKGETELGQLHLICDMLGSPSSSDLDHLALVGVPSSALLMIPTDRPRLMNSKLQKEMPASAFELLNGLLTWDPVNRFTAHTGLKANFLSGYRTPKN